MKIYEPIAVEHDLILRLLNAVEKEVSRISRTNRADNKFIDIVTDFFVTYIDVAHHGKEENILFEALLKKKISPEHTKIMNSLLAEHKLGRKIISELIDASENYTKGAGSELPNIVAHLKDFVSIYRRHINTEDNDYFIQCSKYFSQEEQDSIIQQFWMFDIKIVHEKYKHIISIIEGEE